MAFKVFLRLAVGYVGFSWFLLTVAAVPATRSLRSSNDIKSFPELESPSPLFPLGFMMDLRRDGLGKEEKTGLPKPKGTVITIECPETGETIHCVDFFKQPAFDHPLLKNHIPQVIPHSSRNEAELSSPDEASVFGQVWWKYGECPEGAIPIVSSESATEIKKSRPLIHSTNVASQSKPT